MPGSHNHIRQLEFTFPNGSSPTQVAYCSQQCKDKHYAELHCYECPFLVALEAFEEYEPLMRAKTRHVINALVKRKLEREGTSNININMIRERSRRANY